MNNSLLEECLVIPINDKYLVHLAHITLPIAFLIYCLKVIITKNLDTYCNCLRCLKKYGLKNEIRSYLEIFVTLIIIWFLFGQAAAGLTSILYTKSDKRFIEEITNLKIDELSVYMPRFLFDEFVAVPLRYILWFYLWNSVKKNFNLEDEDFNCQYVFIKGISWGVNVFISISVAAIMIAMINYNFLENSPFVKQAFYIQELKLDCTTKFLIALVIRGIWEIIQINLGNYVLSKEMDILSLLKEIYNKYLTFIQTKLFGLKYENENNNYFRPARDVANNSVKVGFIDKVNNLNQEFYTEYKEYR